MIFPIVLNRPEKRNALDRDSILRIRALLAEARQDGVSRVVLISGEGPDFCSGADLGELRRIRDAGALDNLHDARILGEMFQEMRRHPLPIVAAVRGRALAGGCGLATACDVVLASATARFGYPEVNIGFVPAMVTAILRRNLGEKQAFDLLTTGRILRAEEALAIGLINAVYPDSEFDDHVRQYTEALAARPPGAVQLTKRLLYHLDGMGFDAAIDSGAQMNAIARTSAECRQGIDRFLNKE
ncbi:MAG: enoyl-CoA hydratase/isomerase family protein [Bryobacterales bacterium]|nr:enoyl-CoA hydratase/isomerase family protein [Bryobacterales bacterium]